MNKPPQQLKVNYLFSGPRAGAIARVKSGENPLEGFWGMLRLSHYAIEAQYVELEQVYPPRIAAFLRSHLNIYTIHILLIWKVFSCDVVFTSTAFGVQLIRTLLSYIGVRRPLWVMHDFSIIGMIGERRTLQQRVMYWMASRADGIVTLSRGEESKLRDMFPHLADKIRFIPFGVDLDFFAPSIDRTNTILAAGFDSGRDWGTLIAACDDIGVPVNIETRASRLTKYEPLPNGFTRTTSNMRTLASLYAHATIFVLPLDTSDGLNEAMGCTTVMEAMASGCAIVATRTPTTESYITDGQTGLLVPEGDAEALRTAVQRLLQDKELCSLLGVNARTYAKEHLDANRCAADLAGYFKGLYSD